MSDARLVLSTCADRASAESLARTLVLERLAACVNLVPGVRSIYRWNAGLEEADEVLLLVKTTKARVDALLARMAALHVLPYPLLELFQGPRSGCFLEQRPVHVFRGVAAGPPDYDPFVFLLPLQD